MKFYQLHLTYEAGTSAGFEYFLNKREAEQARKRWLKEGAEGDHGAVIERVEVRPTKRGVMRALNLYASHPDNG